MEDVSEALAVRKAESRDKIKIRVRDGPKAKILTTAIARNVEGVPVKIRGRNERDVLFQIKDLGFEAMEGGVREGVAKITGEPEEVIKDL